MTTNTMTLTEAREKVATLEARLAELVPVTGWTAEAYRIEDRLVRLDEVIDALRYPRAGVLS